MAAIKIINPYEDIEYIDLEPEDGKVDMTRVRSLQVGYGSRVLRIDRDGLWIGAKRFADAPFSVDMDGNMVATSLDLSGYLQIGEALGDIGLGNITGTYIASGAITTAKLSATAIDGMTITGALIRTSSSGGRVVMDDTTDSLMVYDTSGNKRMVLDNDELSFYNSAEAYLGGITTPTTTNLRVRASTGNYLILSVESASYTINMDVAGSTVAYFTSTGLNMNSMDIIGIDEIVFDKRTSTPNRDGEVLHYDNGSTQSVRIQMDSTDYTFDLSFL